MRGFTQAEYVANLTGLPLRVVQKIFDLQIMTLSHNIVEQVNTPRKVDKRGVNYIIPLSPYGELEISIRGKKLVCHFVPNEKFTKMIRDSITNQQDLLQDKVEEAFIELIESRYDSI